MSLYLWNRVFNLCKYIERFHDILYQSTPSTRSGITQPSFIRRKVQICRIVPFYDYITIILAYIMRHVNSQAVRKIQTQKTPNLIWLITYKNNFKIWFGLFFFCFNGTSAIVGYLMPTSPLKKDCSGII